jgi:hypothetical protein
MEKESSEMSELSIHGVESVTVVKDMVIGGTDPKSAFFVTKIMIQKSGGDFPFLITLFN